MVYGTRERDNTKIGRSVLKPAAEALARQRPPIDQDDRYDLAEAPVRPGFALNFQGWQRFANIIGCHGHPPLRS